MSSLPEVDPRNVWRLETPGCASWPRSARPGAANKFYMASADCHANEPASLWRERISADYQDRLPGVVDDAQGRKYQKTEGFRPLRMQNIVFEGEDKLRNESGRTPEERLRDQDRDGIDAEIIFPNKGLMMWATPDAKFSQAMCRVWNDWAWETFAAHNDRLAPMACIASGDLEGAIEEIQRSAKRGFRGLCLPCKPNWGPPDPDALNYNLPAFEPLWAAIQDVDLPITFHVSTGRDPRTSRGNGGAVINYAIHSLTPTMEPIANLCASGVAERFPKLRFGTIEAGIGWVAWLLEAMDEAYKKHHMWVRPKLAALPSDYFKRQAFASFGEDPPGLLAAKPFGLLDNLLWANDYPHHEGTWPHSAEAIERTMSGIDDDARARVLGLNAARIFKFPVPERYRK